MFGQPIQQFGGILEETMQKLGYDAVVDLSDRQIADVVSSCSRIMPNSGVYLDRQVVALLQEIVRLPKDMRDSVIEVCASGGVRNWKQLKDLIAQINTLAPASYPKQVFHVHSDVDDRLDPVDRRMQMPDVAQPSNDTILKRQQGGLHGVNAKSYPAKKYVAPERLAPEESSEEEEEKKDDIINGLQQDRVLQH